MITEQELLEAIAECQGQRNPNANTCMKLASFYIIRDHMHENDSSPPPQMQGYSFASEPTENTMSYDSGTEFSDAIQGMPTYEVMEIVDELMTTLQVINPRLYNSVMRRVAK